MTSSTRFEGEVSVDEYHRLCAEAIAAARDTFVDGRLLIPPDLAQYCDQFVASVFEGQTELASALHPMVVDGLQRAGFWKNAGKSAYEKVPGILLQIEKTAREVIHGDSLQRGFA
jgi:hypothetical protein